MPTNTNRCSNLLGKKLPCNTSSIIVHSEINIFCYTSEIEKHINAETLKQKLSTYISDCFLQQSFSSVMDINTGCAKEQISGQLKIIDARLKKIYSFRTFSLKCSQQMLSQYFIEYFRAYTFKIVLTYISTPTVLEGLQISRNQFILICNSSLASNWK